MITNFDSYIKLNKNQNIQHIIYTSSYIISNSAKKSNLITKNALRLQRNTRCLQARCLSIDEDLEEIPRVHNRSTINLLFDWLVVEQMESEGFVVAYGSSPT